MKRALFAGFLAVMSAQPALAETCQETFVRLLIDGNGDGPVKIHVTQEIKGAPTTKNYFYQVTPGHWMTEMIEPASQPWVLTWDDVMYTSADKGGTWTKLRDMDSAGNQDQARKNQEENAATARDAACATEEIDGVTYDVVEATYDTLQNFKTENHNKYWVNPETGFIAKAVYEMKGEGFESVTTQLIEPAPDLELPTPD
mgnify:CR=1 FL=1